MFSTVYRYKTFQASKGLDVELSNVKILSIRLKTESKRNIQAVIFMTYQPPPPPPPPLAQKKSIGKGVTIAIVIIAIVMLAIVAYAFLPKLSGLAGPNPQITMTNGREGFSGLNYVYYVDATVKNNGASGYVTVFGEINGAGRYEQKSTNLYLENGQSQSITLTFDISVLGSLSNPSISYRAWANPS